MTTSASLNALLQCCGHIGHVQRSRMDLKHRDNLEHSRTETKPRQRKRRDTKTDKTSNDNTDSRESQWAACTV